MRTRKVATEAQNGGKACSGCATDSRACNAEPCASKLSLSSIETIKTSCLNLKSWTKHLCVVSILPSVYLQPTANGPHGMPGVSAQQRVVEESKIEHEKFYKLLQTEVKNAKDQLLNLEIAIPPNVLVSNCINI